MRKIVFPDVEFSVLDQNNVARKISPAEQLYLLVSLPARQGESFSLDDIRRRLPLADRLDEMRRNGEGELLLEDDQHGILVEAIQQSTWTGVSRDALTLADAVLNAETVEVGEVQAPDA